MSDGGNTLRVLALDGDAAQVKRGVEVIAPLVILSVDLASRRYRDNGIAILAGTATSVTVELVRLESLGLTGQPVAEQLAGALLNLSESCHAQLVLLDGPQGWKGKTSPHLHARYCERETFTPGKTGGVGQVKPRSWTRMAAFSIAIFDELNRCGWPRLTKQWAGEQAAIESFPTHAWRCLGLRPIPAKLKCGDLSSWQNILADRYFATSLHAATHDEMQAVVSGLAGLQLLTSGFIGCEVNGIDPYVEDDVWREGYIISPRGPAGLR